MNPRFDVSARQASWGVALCALLFVLISATAASQKSLTWDEPTFIASGFSYLDLGDYRLNPEAPPLAQKLVAIPLLLLDVEAPDYERGFEANRQVAFADRFIRTNGDRIRTLTAAARFPIWLLGGCMVLLVGLWTRRLYGARAALVAAFIAALSPNLIAHGRLATTDLACALGMFAAVYALHGAIRRPTYARAALFGLVTGLALLAKYTSLLLGPIFVLLLLYEWRVGKTPVRQLLWLVAVAAPVGYLTVTLGYDAPLDPRPYLHGLSQIYVRAVPGYQSYLLGMVSDGPFWYYHIVAFLLKTPVPTLVLLGLAAGVLFSGERRPEAAAYLLIPVAIVLTASCFDTTNLGIRRILPVYPFLFAFTGQAMVARASRYRAWIVVGLLTWVAGGAISIYPHHLSYFNVVAGGPSRGPYLMDDSNVDWGQDLPALAEWQMREAPGEPLRLRYFGTAPPELYGVRYTPMSDAEITRPQPGLYAVSAHHLASFRKIGHQMGVDIDWLSRFEPIARAGYSIYIYRFRG